MSRLERGEVRVLAHVLGERVVRGREDLLAQLLELHGEVDLLAGEALLRVVLGEGDVEVGELAGLEADEVGLEARDQAVLAEDERHPLRRAAVERHAVLRPREADDGPVAVPGRPVLDGREGRVLVAQLVDDLVDLRLVDLLDLGGEVEVRVVAELHLGAHLDGRLEAQRLALDRLDDLDVGVGERDDALLDHGVAVRDLDQLLHGLVQDRGGPEDALEDGPGRLAGAEARRRACGARAAGSASRTARSSRSEGTSISRRMELLGAGVAVTFIARRV